MKVNHLGMQILHWEYCNKESKLYSTVLSDSEQGCLNMKQTEIVWRLRPIDYIKFYEDSISRN